MLKAAGGTIAGATEAGMIPTARVTGSPQPEIEGDLAHGIC